MNRRELMTGLGVLSVGGLARGSLLQNAPRANAQASARVPEDSIALPSVVAGIQVPDSAIVRKAMRLAQNAYPPYLLNHALRTFLLGALVGRARGQHFDEEILLLACILHDLGLSDRYQGNLPFEIQGAQAARQFLQENAYSEDKIQIVWDGIAMHPLAIGQFKQPEIALVGEGAGADVLGPDPSEIKKADVDEVVKAFPRLKFKVAFVDTCAEVVRKYPRGASRSFMRDIGERRVPGFSPANICDRIGQSPFSE
jgi:hypothetical protein